MLPFAGTQQAATNVGESQFTRIEAIINSMTSKERYNSAIIDGSRRKHIALGSRTTVQEVGPSRLSRLIACIGDRSGLL
jgi:signal recognition particle subunit SRP54